MSKLLNILFVIFQYLGLGLELGWFAWCHPSVWWWLKSEASSMISGATWASYDHACCCFQLSIMVDKVVLATLPRFVVIILSLYPTAHIAHRYLLSDSLIESRIYNNTNTDMSSLKYFSFHTWQDNPIESKIYGPIVAFNGNLLNPSFLVLQCSRLYWSATKNREVPNNVMALVQLSYSQLPPNDVVWWPGTAVVCCLMVQCSHCHCPVPPNNVVQCNGPVLLVILSSTIHCWYWLDPTMLSNGPVLPVLPTAQYYPLLLPSTTQRCCQMAQCS